MKGKLPKLRFLDLSNNGSILTHLESMFDYSCTWNDLHTLHLDQTTFDFSENESPRLRATIKCSVLPGQSREPQLLAEP